MEGPFSSIPAVALPTASFGADELPGITSSPDEMTTFLRVRLVLIVMSTERAREDVGIIPLELC